MGGEGGAKKVEGMGTGGGCGMRDSPTQKGDESRGETGECGVEDEGPTREGSSEKEEYRERCCKEGGAKGAGNVKKCESGG